ncbi:hypothetical protein Acsp03_05120 [Actinomadura sp. NBRC 104412]|nr:hypothetical protein Acsp03_05120 [Actinomadura sp. NBRC 104412]
MPASPKPRASTGIPSRLLRAIASLIASVGESGTGRTDGFITGISGSRQDDVTVFRVGAGEE